MKKSDQGKDYDWQKQAGLGLVIILWPIVFWGHLAGNFTFMWDFAGGYHAMARNVVEYCSDLLCPEWIFFGGGYPSDLALQQYQLYPPLRLLGAASVDYHLRAATLFHCIHFLVFSIGTYLISCSRLPGQGLEGLTAAFISALAPFIFFGSQHVDYVWGIAWLPWVLFCLDRFWSSSRIQLGLSASLSLFISGGYPGVVLPGLLIAAIWSAKCLQKFGEHPWWRFPAALILPSVFFILRFAPAILERNELLLSEVKVYPDALNFLSIFVTAFPKVLKPDVTVSSLFVPTYLLAGFACNSTQPKSRWVGFTAFLVLIRIFMQPVLSEVPILGSSRFPIADHRGILFILLMVVAFSGRLSWNRTHAFLMALGGVAFLTFLRIAGFSYAWMAGFLLFLSFFAFLILRSKWPRLASAGLLVITVAQMTLAVFVDYGFVWRGRPYHALQRPHLKEEFVKTPQFSRGSRKVVSHIDGLVGFTTGEPVDSAYDASLRLARTVSFRESYPPDSAERRFYREGWMLEDLSGKNAPIRGAIFSVSESEYFFSVDLESDAVLRENELFFPGWEAVVKDSIIYPAQTDAGFRLWRFPSGEYAVKIRFRWVRRGVIKVAIGVSLTLAIVAAVLRSQGYRSRHEGSSWPAPS